GDSPPRDASPRTRLRPRRRREKAGRVPLHRREDGPRNRRGGPGHGDQRRLRLRSPPPRPRPGPLGPHPRHLPVGGPRRLRGRQRLLRLGVRPRRRARPRARGSQRRARNRLRL
ncbi:MAG: hypothetical protein AVDCRST_MAG01-01-3300, partial [uncultured Rubrobacteraceae bacterium]